MDVLDNEVGWPTRALQQEEEEQGSNTADAFLRAPTIQWEAGAQPATPPALLVVATTPATCALLESCLAPAKAVGHVVAGSCHGPGPAPAPAALYAAGDEAQPVLLCCCSAAVPAAAAPAWARGVIQQLQPQRLLVFGAVQVRHLLLAQQSSRAECRHKARCGVAQAVEYRGGGDPSQQLLCYLLQTSAARAAAPPAAGEAPPPLPTGSIASGLPAALLTAAELSGLACEAAVVVDVMPALVPESLGALAATLGAAIRRVVPSAAGLLPGPAAVEAARRRLQLTACRPTSLFS